MGAWQKLVKIHLLPFQFCSNFTRATKLRQAVGLYQQLMAQNWQHVKA